MPRRARDEIKRYFHGKCLNVAGFVSHICSNEFAERLHRCATEDERQLYFLQAFCARAATKVEILHWVETIAEESGAELDDAWAAYCTELSQKWNSHIQIYDGPNLSADELTHRLSEFTRTALREAACLANSGSQRPAAGETIGKIGVTAILLLPVGLLGPEGAALAIPIFVVLAAKHVWDDEMSRLDDRRSEYQNAISSRLALLGNRVGSEFEREVWQRITDLHIWQERSIRAAAAQVARERIGLI